MAKSKKKGGKKSKTTRRRKVGALSLNAKSPLVTFGSIAAGYLLSDLINTQLKNVTGTLDPKIVAAVQAAGGLLLMMKTKGLVTRAAGGILLGSGAKAELKEFGVINGLPTINGYKDLRTINGLPAPVRRVAAPSANRDQLHVIAGVQDSYNDN